MTLQELLDYYDLKIINAPKKIGHNTKLELESSDGYRYYLSKDNLANSYRRNGVPCKYFKNSYTEYNLSNFLKLKTNGDVVVKDFQNAQNVLDKILLHCNSIGFDYARSINEITNGWYYPKREMPGYHGPNYKSLDIIKKEAEKFDIEIISDYKKDNRTPMKFICNKHRDMGVQEKSWFVIAHDKYPCDYCYREFQKTLKPPKRTIKPKDAIKLYKLRRPKASNKVRLRSIDAKKRFEAVVSELKNPFIEIVGEYSGRRKDIECKCLKCGEFFHLRADYIRKGFGHKGCNKSLGEERIEKYFMEHNINYVYQYHFGDCVRKIRDMPFDFYLPDSNIAIEYDGIQHYKPIDRFGGEKAFTEQKLNDNFKTNYCAEHNVIIIRIPYTEYDNIEKFLDNYFKK